MLFLLAVLFLDAADDVLPRRAVARDPEAFFVVVVVDFFALPVDLAVDFLGVAAFFLVAAVFVFLAVVVFFAVVLFLAVDFFAVDAFLVVLAVRFLDAPVLAVVFLVVVDFFAAAFGPNLKDPAARLKK